MILVFDQIFRPERINNFFRPLIYDANGRRNNPHKIEKYSKNFAFSLKRTHSHTLQIEARRHDDGMWVLVFEIFSKYTCKYIKLRLTSKKKNYVEFFSVVIKTFVYFRQSERGATRPLFTFNVHVIRGLSAFLLLVFKDV